MHRIKKNILTQILAMQSDYGSVALEGVEFVRTAKKQMFIKLLLNCPSLPH